MANHTKPDDNSAFLGGALVLFAFILKFALPEPYNDIAGKVLIGVIVVVVIAFFAITIINEKK
jgi:RsiW-degrading membrane proteinase PrsW (M82 family)